MHWCPTAQTLLQLVVHFSSHGEQYHCWRIHHVWVDVWTAVYVHYHRWWQLGDSNHTGNGVIWHLCEENLVCACKAYRSSLEHNPEYCSKGDLTKKAIQKLHVGARITITEHSITKNSTQLRHDWAIACFWWSHKLQQNWRCSALHPLQAFSTLAPPPKPDLSTWTGTSIPLHPSVLQCL